MINFFGKLLTAYAFATLNGAGLLVIFFAGSCWYIQGNFGWIALGVYLVVWWIIVQCLIRAIANWIKKNSIFLSQEAWENHRKKVAADKLLEPEVQEKKEKVRATRHGY